MKILLILFLSLSLFSKDRCIHLEQKVRKYHYLYFGISFPYKYSLSQLKAESNCRNIQSKDYARSIGVSQITPKIWGQKLKRVGIPHLRTLDYQIRGQAYINYYYFKRLYCTKLFIMFQAYNGGLLINRELKKAKSCNWNKMKRVCKRRIIKFRNGQKIDACKINYDYSKKIYKYSGNKELSELWEFY